MTVLVAPEVLSPLRGSSYQPSADRNFLLYRTDVTQVNLYFDGLSSQIAQFKETIQVWRHSSRARYSVLDVRTNQVYPLQPTPSNPQLLLRYATWNKVGQGLIYVYDNDIYYRSSPSATSDTRLTTDGKRDVIFNGIPDWVYEGTAILQIANLATNVHQLFACRGSVEYEQCHLDRWWWGPHGVRIIRRYFGRKFWLPDVRPAECSAGSISQNHPHSLPKGSFANIGTCKFKINLCSLWIGWQYKPESNIADRQFSHWNRVLHTFVTSEWNRLSVSEMYWMTSNEYANIFFSRDHYIYRVAWPRNDEVFVAWMNRQQNSAWLSFCNATTFQCVVVWFSVSNGLTGIFKKIPHCTGTIHFRTQRMGRFGLRTPFHVRWTQVRHDLARWSRNCR